MIRFHSNSELSRTGRVARAFGLRDVALAELNASRVAGYFEAVSNSSSSQPNVNISDDATAELREDGNILTVMAKFSVSVRNADSEVLKVSGRFDLKYQRQIPGAEIANDDAQLFAKINGVYNCWPYIREVVSNAFGRMGFPPYTIDSLVIAQKPEPEELAHAE